MAAIASRGISQSAFLSRRDVLGLLVASAVASRAAADETPATAQSATPAVAEPARVATAGRRFRIRAITAGVRFRDAGSLAAVEDALAVLARARNVFVGEGFEVQTVRIATTPFVAGLGARDRERMLPTLRALDALVAQEGAVASIGPVLTTDTDDAELAQWVVELLRATNRLSLSIAVAVPGTGTHPLAAAAAARTMAAVAKTTPGGIGNFRFAAAACVPAGTPFFPVAYHDGDESLALGLETARLVEESLNGAAPARDATERVQKTLNAELAPVERIAIQMAQAEGRRYLGIDPSPAPGLDRSIGVLLCSTGNYV